MKFRLLGCSVEAETQGRPVHLGGAKPRLLLAVLLMAERRWITRDKLIERVWHEGLPDGADQRDIVQSCVSDLRGHLGRAEPGADALIPRREPGYRLLADPEEVDAHRFLARAAKVRDLAGGDDHQIIAAAREALAEWPDGAEPLVGLVGRWAACCRRDLLVRRRDVLMERLDAELRIGEGAGLVPELQALHRAWPFEERIVRALLLAHARADDQVRAMEIYERFTERIAARFAAEPGATTKDLYRRILEKDPGLHPGAAMPSQPPPEIIHLAHRVTDVLTPALPFLAGLEMPDPDDLNHLAPPVAKRLWSALQKSEAPIPEAENPHPDQDTLRTQIAAALAADRALAHEASTILSGAAPEPRHQVNINGPYFHRGDNIYGTSIKYYRG